MGNRAVIVWQDENGDVKDNAIGVYLHWNGGRDSIEAFLAYCGICGFRNPSRDSYGLAAFVSVVTNFFGFAGSVGIGPLSELDTDNGDNGVYVCNGWKIVDRIHAPEKEQDNYKLPAFVLAINEAQPQAVQKPAAALEKLVEDWLQDARELD